MARDKTRMKRKERKNIAAGVAHGEHGLSVRLSPADVQSICSRIARSIEPLLRENRPAVVLCSPEIRASLKHITESQLPQLTVLSYNEVTSDTIVDTINVVSENTSAAA